MNDRGHKKWTALMLPEHKERIQQWVRSQDDVQMPTLDPDQLQEIDDRIRASMQEHARVQLSYYQHKRFTYIYGWITRCDPLAGYLQLDDDDGVGHRILMSLITDIHLQ